MIKKNRKSDFPVMPSNLLPTVCDMVNVSVPSDRPIDGVSILPFIKGQTEKRNTSMKWAYNINGVFEGEYQAAISDDQYKVYAMYKNNEATTELYDLKNDPYEEKDIKDKIPKVHDKLKSDLEEWRQSVKNSAKKCKVSR